MKQIYRVFLTFPIVTFLLISTNPIGAQNWDWVEQISGENTIQVEGIVRSGSSIFSSGIFEGTATFLSSPGAENNLTTTQFGGFVLCHSQNGELIWANVIEATSAVQIKGITTDNSENIFITGSYSGTSATFYSQNSDDNILLEASQNHDTFIAKYDNHGNLLWAGVVAQSSALDRGFGIQVDSFGNIYIGGFWRGGNLNFSSSSISIPYNSTINWGNGFIAKLNSDFVPLWVSTVVGGAYEGGVARLNGGVALSNDDGIYASGPFQKTVYFDKTYYADGSELLLPETTYTAGTTIAQDVIAFKLNSDGSFGWARHFSNTDKAGNSGNNINSNRDNGDVFFIGNFVGTITIQNESSADPVLLSSNGGEDNYIIKYNSDGIIDWAFSFGGLSNEGINDVSHSNEIVTASGYFSGSVYLGSSIAIRDTLTSAGGTDMFLINLSNTGTYLSSTNLGGTLNEDMLSLDSDNLSNATVGGFFSSPNFRVGENDLENGGSSDAFLAHHINIHILPTVSEISCSQGHDGTLGLEVFGGGQEPYSYEVSLVGGDEIDAGVYSAPLSFDNLEAGVYKFTVTDDLGRTVTKFYHLIAPDPIDINGVVTDVTGCYGGENGGITLTVTGGVGEYTYFWDTPDGYGVVPTSQNQSSLTAGTYVVTVTDENGCFATETFEIKQPLQIHFDGSIITGNTSSTPASPNGSIDLMVNNGSEPYTIIWKGPNGFESTDEDLFGIRGGTYILSLYDANGCFKDTSVNVDDKHLFNAWIVETVNPKCKGGSDGFASVDFFNSTGGVTIEWSSGQSNVITATNLSAGEYSVTLTDDMGTPSDASDDISISLMPVLIGEPAFALSATPTVTKTTCPADNDGSIQLTVNGWSQPYNFNWSTSNGSGLVNEQKDQYNLTVGSYTYSVTDKYGCVVGSSVNLSSSYAAPSFTVDVSPDTDVCEGTEILVTASPGFSYQFLIDDVPQGEFSPVNTFAIPNPTNGMVVKVVGMNTAGCTSQSDEITLAVTPNVGEPSFTSGASMLCAGSSEVYLATAENAETIAYSIESGTATVNPTTGEVSSADSDFIIRATATGVNGCGEKYVDLAVTVNPIPSPTISTSDRTDWTEGEEVSVTFTVDITDAAYQWQKDGVDLTNATNATYTATSQGEYSVLVTKAGCTGESNKISVNVTSIPTYTVTFNVKDPGQQPIENAQVSVSGFSPVVTNASGVATIDAADGTYSYTITATNYIDYQSTFTVNGDNVQLAINMVAVSADLNEISDIKLFPNPFTNEIRISDSHKVKRVVITNIAGQKVMEVQLDGTDRINTQSLSSGVYLLRIVSHDGESAIYRMVKDN